MTENVGFEPTYSCSLNVRYNHLANFRSNLFMTIRFWRGRADSNRHTFMWQINCDETIVWLSCEEYYNGVKPICILPHFVDLMGFEPIVCLRITPSAYWLNPNLWTRRESNPPLSPCKGETPAIGTCEPKKLKEK